VFSIGTIIIHSENTNCSILEYTSDILSCIPQGTTFENILIIYSSKRRKICKELYQEQHQEQIWLNVFRSIFVEQEVAHMTKDSLFWHYVHLDTHWLLESEKIGYIIVHCPGICSASSVAYCVADSRSWALVRFHRFLLVWFSRSLFAIYLTHRWGIPSALWRISSRSRPHIWPRLKFGRHIFIWRVKFKRGQISRGYKTRNPYLGGRTPILGVVGSGPFSGIYLELKNAN